MRVIFRFLPNIYIYIFDDKIFLKLSKQLQLYSDSLRYELYESSNLKKKGKTVCVTNIVTRLTEQ